MTEGNAIDIAALISAESDLPEAFSVNDSISANWVVRKVMETR